MGLIGVNKLIKIGHERIAIVNGFRETSTYEERFEGYKKALREAEIDLDKNLVKFKNFKEPGVHVKLIALNLLQAADVSMVLSNI